MYLPLVQANYFVTVTFLMATVTLVNSRFVKNRSQFFSSETYHNARAEIELYQHSRLALAGRIERQFCERGPGKKCGQH